MAQERPATPEKQLLKLIENRKAISADVRAHAVKHTGLSFFSPGAWKGRISFVTAGIQKWSKGGEPRQFNIKLVNNLLSLLVIILCGYFILNLSSLVTHMGKIPEIQIPAEGRFGEVVDKSGLLSTRSTASKYVEAINTRDIFKMGAKVIPSVESLYKPPNSQIREITQNLKLVGISWSDNPDAMIEDSSAFKTFFVKRGQSIGPIKVEAIFKDKVVLSYQNEEIELR